MNVSPGLHPIPLHPGDAPTYLGWIGKHLDLAQETQDRSSQAHLENFGGFEPASPPRWLLHHLELTACTCQNLLECSFTCWELPPAAAEGLECPPPPRTRIWDCEGAGMSPVPPCHPGPFLVGSVHPGARGPMPAGPEPCRCAQVSLLPHGCAAPAWGAQQCHLALPYLIHDPSVGSSPIPGELHPSGCLPPACASQRTCTCHASTRDPPRLLPRRASGSRALRLCPGVLVSLWMFPRFLEHLEFLLLLLRCFLLTCAPSDSRHLLWHQTGQTGMDSGSPDSPGPSSPSLEWGSWKTHLCSGPS